MLFVGLTVLAEIEWRNQLQGNEDVTKVLFIRAEWDPEANVWVATSDDVPGLATEADTLEALSAKLDVLVPELLEANGHAGAGEIPFELLARKFSVARGHVG